jgi:hypothetical protein
MTESKTRPSWLTGCLATVATIAVAGLVAVGWLYQRQQASWEHALAAQAEAAREAFVPAMDKLEQGIADPGYDIDKTVRVIHQMDKALENQDDLHAYLSQLAMQDYRDVAPEILQARKDLMAIQMALYAKQTEVEDQQAMWELTSELVLSTLSVVSVSGEASVVNPAGEFSVDRAKAQELLTELKEKQASHRQLIRDITATEQTLFDAMVAYSEVYYDFVQEWDELSVLRDRAYLAAHNGDWAAARSSAQLAMEKAPQEKEAHLLAALAMIEADNNEDHATAAALIETYIDEHPESSAPAFLLLGVLHQRSGQDQQAMLAFQQSAAYYPKQAEQLTDMLDPYEMRSYLTRSREGGFIRELYQSTMLGAGYFSPDLQMARMMFEQGEDAAARAKVLDHFARRRAQKQWDFILSDIAFCNDILGPHFWEIFPEDTYLDLIVDAPMLGKGLNLSIQNRSTHTLHNATLVLALHLTDMYPNDYKALVIEPSLPAVLANDTTSFGTATVDIDIDGTPKTEADVVHHRAILISNEAVVWVDTDAYKIGESNAFRERRRTETAAGEAVSSHPSARRHPTFKSTFDTLIETAAPKTRLSVESKFGADNILVTLPRELAILRPLFRLRHGDTVFDASDNFIEGDQIMLRFPGVQNFDDEPGGDLELLLASPFGDVSLLWTPGGPLTWNYNGVTR